MNAPVHLAAPPSPTELVALARSRALPDRQRLLLGVAALCDAAPPTPGDPGHAVLGEIFLLLAGQAERDIRRTLSECLAEAAWAPPALINMLALDEIEIARPIIARSPVLDAPALLRVLIETTLDHQIEVARRPDLPNDVCEAVVDLGQMAVLSALASNPTARIGDNALHRLIEASEKIAALRSPLARHPRLNAAMAERLYAYVGDALRQSIGERFRVDDPDLASAVAHAARQATPAPPEAHAAPPITDAERQEMDRRLVAKLKASNQLRPGYLIRAIREGRLSLFQHALAELGGFSAEQVRRAMHSESANPLLLACASVGIDRAVFPALLQEIRRLNNGLPKGDLPASVLTRGLGAAAPSAAA
ncbi:DUF2336 domain-containing protein [Brevundimonas lutea]|uniref:DUF2336 domain-containing protein n=1 Tax=Brevundimonas lutea TaxID=2293980 RepID=UPI001F0CD42A|nr:DUF2336 domain-containing protein [Brevundimonas lutea]